MKTAINFLCLFFLLISCTDIKLNEPSDQIKNPTPYLSKLLKNIDGEIVESIPVGVFELIYEEISNENDAEKLELLNSCYNKVDDNYVLNDDLIEDAKNNNIKTRYDALPIMYSAHVRNLGWLPAVGLGKIAGTVNENRRLEAISFAVGHPNIVITARAHLHSTGWQSSKTFNSNTPTSQYIGTTGQERDMQALEINVRHTGGQALYVAYQVHMRSIGWQNLVGNGQMAGTVGENRRIEAFLMQIYLM